MLCVGREVHLYRAMQYSPNSVAALKVQIIKDYFPGLGFLISVSILTTVVFVDCILTRGDIVS